MPQANRRFGAWWWARLIGLLLLLAALAVVTGLTLLDTAPGRRFVIDQIERSVRDDGLTIRIGRIDGSIYGNARLRDVRLGDPSGQFLAIESADVAWQPLDFLWYRRLTINNITVPSARLDRLPRLRDTDDDKPILPDFDIRIAALNVERLIIGRAIAGKEHNAVISGEADVQNGSANIGLHAHLRDGSDRVRVALVAQPDRGLFDVDGDLMAPAGGVLAALMGADGETTAVVRGDGDWSSWRGSLLARSGRLALASISLSAQEGRLRATGRVWPETRLTGALQRLTRGGVAVALDGRIANRRWAGQAQVVSAAMRIGTNGQADIANRRFAAMRIDGWLRDGALLVDGLDAQGTQLSLLLDGDWSAARYEYRLSAQSLAMGKVRLVGVEALGTGVARRAGLDIPVALRIASSSGVAPPIDRALSTLRADGLLNWRQGVLTTDGLRVNAVGLNGRLGMRYAGQARELDVTLDGALPGLELAGLGRVDLTVNARGGRVGAAPFTANGRAQAAVRRFDNGFLRGLSGGTPNLVAGFVFGADRVLRLSDVRLNAPDLSLSGTGQRLSSGSFLINATGTHRRYGPLVVAIDGPLARPRVDVMLAAPFAPASLSNVHIVAIPNATGFALETRGGSLLGQFTGSGAIVLPRGQSAVLDIARLSVGDSVARGRLAIVPRGLVGQLLVSGGGVDGRILLSAPTGIQRVAVTLNARNAQFVGPPALAIARGQIQATLLLDPAGTDVEATFETVGFRRATLSIARLAGTARLVNGVGVIRTSIAGSRGREFSFQSTIGVTRDRFVIRGNGSLARQPLRLTSAAVVRRIDGGWALAPSEMTFAGGRIQLSGQLADGVNRIEAGLERVPLSLLDLGWPDLGLGGSVDGRLTYVEGVGAPSGSAQVRITGLTRAGLGDRSTPIDVALNAALTPANGAMRAVISRNGSTIGRMQARLSPLNTNGPLLDRLTGAPLFAQLRYDGEAGTLWRMTGVQSLSISGDVAIAADVSGTLNAPQIRGALRTANGRLESLQTGTVVTGINAIGQFDGPRLRLRDIRGLTSGGGTITGAGDINLGLADDLAIDLRLETNRALLIERDDLVARVTGPVRLSRDADGGLIAGQLTLNAGSFRLGRATAAQALSVINVIETNVPADRPAAPRSYLPWRLDLAIRGRDGFVVTGLGIESVWSTDVAVRGDAANFSIFGNAELVRGDYIFAGRRFELESGTIRFDGSSPADPALDIVAVDDISGIDASIRVRGTGLRPEITFASVPALPEDELLSRILFGASITEISVTEAAQLTLALASLRSGSDGLDPINAIRRATGLDRLRILPADAVLGTGTAIAAGKYVTRRAYVEIITDGQGYSATRAEYQITRWLALLGSISTIGRESVNIRIQRNY